MFLLLYVIYIDTLGRDMTTLQANLYSFNVPFLTKHILSLRT
jgi:hypothetical protein